MERRLSVTSTHILPRGKPAASGFRESTGLYLSVPTFALLTALAMFMAMITTYLTCVHKGNCPTLPHLPTISNTWDDPPGNFISRFVVGNVAFNMGLCQFVLWVPSKGSHKPWLTLGVFSVFCLSIVGAVCDSASDPECKGNNALHSTSAVIFFILYNMNMVILTKREAKNEAVSATMLALSLLTKLRWLPMLSSSGVKGVHDQTILAIVEWSDVFFILLWTVHFIWKHRQDYTAGVVLSPSNGPNEASESQRLLFLPASIMTLVGGLLYVTTLGVSLFFIYHQHAVPSGSLPYISDMWVNPPGNWLSRWSVVQGCILMSYVHVCLYALDGGSTTTAKLVTAISLVGIAGLDIVGVCNEKEYLPLHQLGAGMYFGGYDLFMVLRTTQLMCSTDKRHKAQQRCAVPILVFIAALSCGLTWLRVVGVHTMQLYITPQKLHDVFVPILEWTNAIAIAAYALVAVFSYGKLSSQLGVVIMTPNTANGANAENH